MTDIEINGNQYRVAGRLNAKKQFHIVRRLAPIFAAGAPAIRHWIETARPTINSDGTPSTESPLDLDSMFDAFGPLAIAIGELTDEASDYVIGMCLSVCQRQGVGGVWANVATQNGTIMFDDLDMVGMLRLVMVVLQENLAGFLGGKGGSLTGP